MGSGRRRAAAAPDPRTRNPPVSLSGELVTSYSSNQGVTLSGPLKRLPYVSRHTVPVTVSVVLRLVLAAGLLINCSCAGTKYFPVHIEPETQDEQYEDLIGRRVRVHMNDGTTFVFKVTGYEAPMIVGRNMSGNRSTVIEIDSRDIYQIALPQSEAKSHNGYQVVGAYIMVGMVIGLIGAIVSD